ncbi:MAG: HEAT repeat domain-containing protein [Armatimonadetes bacterium]|nr:HEAT repeat domain-containing protein [Armatimonadota bacterium]
MNRRSLLGAAGAGVLSAWASRLLADAPAPDLPGALRRFVEVDWQKHAVMVKPPGAEPPWQLRLEAEYQAACAGEAAVAPLLDLSEHASPHVRGFAAQMLGVIGEPRAQDRLLSLLRDDPSALARNYAVEALSRLPSAPEDATVAAAIAATRRDANGNVAFSAQQAELRLQKRVPGGNALCEQWVAGYDPGRLGAARVAEPAPAFELADDRGEKVRLAGFQGRNPVVLLFQLADW